MSATASLLSQAPTIVETKSVGSHSEEITIHSLAQVFTRDNGLEISFQDPYKCPPPPFEFFSSQASKVREGADTYLKVTRPSTHDARQRERVSGEDHSYLSADIMRKLTDASNMQASRYVLHHVPITHNGSSLFEGYANGSQGPQMEDWPIVFRLAKSQFRHYGAA